MTVHQAKTQISLGIHPVWSESSLSTQWVAKDSSFLHADSEDGWMPRLIWVFTGHTNHFVSFVIQRLICFEWRNSGTGYEWIRVNDGLWISASLQCYKWKVNMFKQATSFLSIYCKTPFGTVYWDGHKQIVHCSYTDRVYTANSALLLYWSGSAQQTVHCPYTDQGLHSRQCTAPILIRVYTADSAVLHWSGSTQQAVHCSYTDQGLHSKQCTAILIRVYTASSALLLYWSGSTQQAVHCSYTDQGLHSRQCTAPILIRVYTADSALLLYWSESTQQTVQCYTDQGLHSKQCTAPILIRVYTANSALLYWSGSIQQAVHCSYTDQGLHSKQCTAILIRVYTASSALLLYWSGSTQQTVHCSYTDQGLHSKLGVVAWSEACSLGMQAAPSLIPTTSTFFRGDLVMKTFLRPFYSLSSADSRRAVVSYWRKNVH